MENYFKLHKDSYDETNNLQTQILLQKIKNGRINIQNENIPTTKSFPLYQENKKGDTYYQNEALKTILTLNDPLYKVFFSKENINLIQNTIKYKIWINSDKKYQIKNQSYDNLLIIMRSIYLQYAKHKENCIKEQINELNNLIYDYSIPNILSNIELYLGFKRDVSNAPVFLNRPINVSNQGLKSVKHNLF